MELTLISFEVFEMNRKRINELRLMAERMIVEQRTDYHQCTRRGAAEEDYCAGCQKMRDALQLLQLAQDLTVLVVV
jgi:hypothetical protein